MAALIGQGEPLTPVQEQNSWPYKAVLAAKGNRTILGCILLQIIGKAAKNPPNVETTATVDKDGLTWCVMSRINGERGLVCVGHIHDIRDEFRRLADHLKLDDAERLELFDELRKWVATDLRADHDEMKRHRH